MIKTMFCEASETDGNAGPLSMRRVLAFILALAAVGLFVGGLFFSEKGWVVFIPGIAALAGALLLLFFTTWNDVTGIITALKKAG